MSNLSSEEREILEAFEKGKLKRSKKAAATQNRHQEYAKGRIMGKIVKIRESAENDKDAIFRVHLEAFGEEEGESVSQLAVDLLEDPTALPLLSLVAEEGSEIVGNIIFSSVTVKDSTASNAYILAPLAVINDMQGRGVGKKLISEGLDILKDRHAEFVLVLGDPNYYSRVGFEAGHGISPPYDLDYPEAWMALELEKGALKSIRGTAQCAASLSLPELW